MTGRRSLTLREMVALIYTSAGSQRNIAALTGLSHQKIGRILHHPEFGGYAETSRVWNDPDTIAAIETAFAIHTDIARDQARGDGIPFDQRTPVFTRRLPMHKKKRIVDPRTGEIRYEKQYHPNGKPVLVEGARIVVPHAHWLSDELRRRVIDAVNRSRFYHNASVGSWVDLNSYFKQGEDYWRKQSAKGKYRNDAQRAHRKNLQNKIKRLKRRGQTYGFIYTPMVPLMQPLDAVMFNLDKHINAKHAPASSDPRAIIANEILLQSDIAKDTRAGKHIPQAPTRKAPTNGIQANKRAKSSAPRKNRGNKRD